MLKSLAKVSKSDILSRLHLNIRYLGVSEHLEILDCPSSADSGTCHVYLLPVVHFSAESRKAALSLTAYTRPQLVYLELDSTREIVLNDPENEMAVANKTAKALGLDVFQGDISEWACSLFEKDILNKMADKYYSGSNLIEIKKMVKDKAKVDVRNRLMINDIWQLAKHKESIVAIVGSDHLYGMVHHWKQKKMGFLGMDAEAVIYKKFLLKHMIQHYDEPKGEHSDSLIGRAYYKQKQIGTFHPEELDKLKQMKEQLLVMKIFYPSLYNQTRFPGAEEHNLYTKKLSGVELSARNDGLLAFVENFSPTIFVDYHRGVQQAITSDHGQSSVSGTDHTPPFNRDTFRRNGATCVDGQASCDTVLQCTTDLHYDPSLPPFTSIPSGSLLNILDQEDNILGDFSMSRRSSQPLQSNWQAVLEFDWELDELEEFTDKLIEAENLSEDQKDALKEFLKRKVREAVKYNTGKGSMEKCHCRNE